MPGQLKKGRKRKVVGANNVGDENDEDDEIVFNLPKAKKVKRDVDDGADPEPRRSPNGYILPDPLPKGLIVQDLRGNKWKLGKSVGLGGFGEVYSAALLNGKKYGNEIFVVKVEPHTNGPLFVELNFYCRATKGDDIATFQMAKGLSHLGIPAIQGSGSFVFRKKRLRFLVMPRYGIDLQTVLDESKSSLSLETTRSIAVQVINSYEYLHSKGYVHKDLKGSNLLFGRGKSDDRKNVYLVDYGLTSRFVHMGLHKPFFPDRRSAHEGTLEFTSRDSHLGCVSRRSDFEVLLYNIIDWIGGKLPWDSDDNLKPPAIYEMKKEAFRDVNRFLTRAFANKGYPACLESLMSAVKDMSFEEAPDYNHLRSLFLASCGGRSDVNGHHHGDEVVLSLELQSPSPNLRNVKRRKMARKSVENRAKMASTSAPWSDTRMSAFNEKMADVTTARSNESLMNPTPAMIEQMRRMKDRKRMSSNVGTRRRGATAKRRIPNKNVVEGNFLIMPPPSQASGNTATKSDAKSMPTTRSTSLRQHLARMVSVPRFEMVSNLVKSLFPFENQQQEN